MVQVFKKNGFVLKLFACLFLALYFIFCIIGANVFASSSISVDDSTVITNSSMDELHPYFCIIRRHINDNYIYALYYCDVPLVYHKYNSYNIQISPSVSGSKFYYPYASDGIPLPADYDSWSKGWADNTSGTQIESYDSTVLYTNYDIVDFDDNSKVVFQAPPHQVEGEQVLAPIVEHQEMKPLEEILRILPIVMIVVVSYLALRKGLTMLFSFLRQS